MLALHASAMQTVASTEEDSLMSRTLTLALLVVSIALTASSASSAQAPGPAPGPAVLSGPELLDPNPAPSTIKVSFPGLKDNVVDNASVFKGFGCAGENKSLPIKWEGAPK